MKLVRLLGMVLGVLLAVALVGATGAYLIHNPERETLDAAARSGASGAFVTLSDGVTHYEVRGPDTARVAVLVHGFSVPYYIWDSTAVALEDAGYRVIRYDVFGRGLSDRPAVPYDGSLYDRQLDDLLDSLGVRQPIDLMGLSYGGYVTSHYTVSNPDRVRTLTLVDPAVGGGSLPAWLGWPVIGHWYWQVFRAPVAALGQPSDFLHPERWPDWVARYEPQMRYTGFGRALRRASLHSASTNYAALYADVARTGVPVLLVWGRQDRTVPESRSVVVRAAIPHVEYFPVDSAGHLPHLEQSGVVHARLLQFLTQHADSVPTP